MPVVMYAFQNVKYCIFIFCMKYTYQHIIKVLSYYKNHNKHVNILNIVIFYVGLQTINICFLCLLFPLDPYRCKLIQSTMYRIVVWREFTNQSLTYLFDRSESLPHYNAGKEIRKLWNGVFLKNIIIKELLIFVKYTKKKIKIYIICGIFF